MKKLGLLVIVVWVGFIILATNDMLKTSEEYNMKQYYLPSEEDKHEGTWLIWPHHYTYGKKYRDEIESVWIDMVDALHHGENVHIIAYNQLEQERIINILKDKQFDINKIDFVIAKSDDVWVRDTGPIFVTDQNNELNIADFRFDGWGEKVAYQNDDKIPQVIADKLGIPILDISDFVLEGGSIESDGHGTAMLCKSSVVSKNRNKDISIQEAEKYLSQYLGIKNFIWLEGALDEDITDAHIDGIARFYDDKTLLTVSKEDFMELYEDIDIDDYEILKSAKNTSGELYNIITLPMTAKNVDSLDYKGSYLNYYIGNDVVLVPIYNDVNDQKAIDILSQLYKDRKIVPIDVRKLYPNGGMLHCITQQQPLK